MAVRDPAARAQDEPGSGPVRDLARKSKDWPIGRAAAVAVVLLWLVIAIAVLERWISPAPAAFFAAGAFTLAIMFVLAYDAAVDWADPDEDEPLGRRLQPERAWPWLKDAAGLLRVGLVPVCFAAGAVLGHFAWH